MKRIIAGLRMIVSGIAETGGAMAQVLGSIPRCTLSPDTEPMTEAEAKARIAELKAKYGLKNESTPQKDVKPRKVRLGDFSDDIEALRRDALILGEDMRMAARRLKDVE